MPYKNRDTRFIQVSLSVTNINGIYYSLSFLRIICVPVVEVKSHSNCHFRNQLLFFVIILKYIETVKLNKLRKFKDFYISLRCSPTTVSTWVDQGNWSTQQLFSTRYPAAVMTSRSRARLVGLQLT